MCTIARLERAPWQRAAPNFSAMRCASQRGGEPLKRARCVLGRRLSSSRSECCTGLVCKPAAQWERSLREWRRSAIYTSSFQVGLVRNCLLIELHSQLLSKTHLLWIELIILLIEIYSEVIIFIELSNLLSFIRAFLADMTEFGVENGGNFGNYPAELCPVPIVARL